MRMQDMWDARLEICRTGGMQDMRDARHVGCWTGGIQERKKTGKEVFIN